MGRAAQGTVRSNRGGDPSEGAARPRDGHATLREIVPWHVEPAKSEPPPAASPSGIRLVEPPPEVRDALAAYEAGASEVLREVVAEDGPAEAPASSARARVAEDAPLSFRVYTLADLDARRPDADPANRMSRLMFDSQPRPPSPWGATRTRAWELAVEALAWGVAFARTRVRPSAEPLRLRLVAARQALVVASAATDWKRVSTLGGMSLGAVVALLAIVLTVADLTDDLKPARSAREPDLRAPAAKLEVGSPSTPSVKVETAASAELAGKPAQPEKVAASPAPEAAPAPPAFELDEAAPAPAPARAAKAAPRGVRPVAAARKPAPAPATPTRSTLALSGTPIPGSPLAPNAGPAPRARGGTKLSFRDADEVFRP